MNWRVDFTYCSVIYMARPSLRPLAITIALKCTMHQRFTVADQNCDSIRMLQQSSQILTVFDNF